MKTKIATARKEPSATRMMLPFIEQVENPNYRPSNWLWSLDSVFVPQRRFGKSRRPKSGSAFSLSPPSGDGCLTAIYAASASC